MADGQLSILTNPGAKTALNVLTDTKNALSETQKQISTGKKISEAKDGPSTFTVAKTMKGDTATFKKLEENIGLNQSITSVAADNTDRISGLVNDLKEKVTSATDPAKPNDDVQKDIDSLKNQIQNIVDASQFKGVNMINKGGETDFLMSVDRTDNGLDGNQVAVENQDLNVSQNGGLSKLAGLSVEGLDNVTSSSGDLAVASSSANVTLQMPSKNIGPGRTLTISGDDGAGSSSQITLMLTDQSGVNGSPLSSVDGSPIAVEIGSNPGPTTVASNVESALTGAGSMFATTGSANAIGVSATGSGGVKLTQTTSASATVSKVDGGFNFDTVMNRVEDAQQTTLDAAAEFGSVQQRLESQKSFTNKLMDSVDNGIGQLVDANMAEQAAKLQALQAQQQLGNQALSIANRQPQSLIGLFGG